MPSSVCTTLRCALVIVAIAIASVGTAAEFHVSPTGTPDGKGTPEQPWDLATGLSGRAGLKPGDVLWLHGATYRGGFQSELAGSPEKPIVVRGRPGERVTIDIRARDERDRGVLFLFGADTVYRDFEVTCSDDRRVTRIPGSWPDDVRRGSVDVRGSRLSLVNLVVHDLECGFGFWSEGEGGEISGCLIYNNGWQGPERAHGHGIYAQNARGTKWIADNIVFHQFAYGIHAYGSEKASLKGFEIEGNIAFENGCLSKNGERSTAILVGGGCPAERITIRDNVAYGGNIRAGYTWGAVSQDIVVTGNYSDAGFVLRDFRQATVKHNTFVSSSNVVNLEGEKDLLKDGLKWDENELYVTEGRWGEASVIANGKSQGLPFDQWRQATGCDRNSTFTKGAPTKTRVVVRPNRHEPGRAQVAVINPQQLAEVEVDLSKVLKEGQEYRLVSAKDFYGKALISGTYDGKPVRVPMKPVAGPQPVGLPNAKLPVTEPGFAAFVVLPGKS
jgi:hypothetical protein